MQNGNGSSLEIPSAVAGVSRNVRATTPAVSASRVRDSIAVRPSLLHFHERKKMRRRLEQFINPWLARSARQWQGLAAICTK